MSIDTLQDAIANMPQVDCEVVNHFSDGIYARELFIPAGVCLVGAKHKTRHFFMVTQGECLIHNGGKTESVRAPYMVETQVGDKRAITAIKDTVCITFHVTDETDVVKIGESITEPERDMLANWKRLEVVK